MISVRVLHVDDDDLMRRAFARVFRHEAILVEGAASVAEAERAIATGGGEASYDVIVTDLEMPGEGGDDLHRWLLERYPRLAARTLVYTAGAETQRRAAWLRSLPAGRVIPKPTDADTLVCAIRAAALR